MEGIERLMDGLLVDGSVQFETGKADLASTGLPLLNQIGAGLSRCTGFIICIIGHTDNVGDEQAIIRLSEASAQAVVRYLAG